MLQRVRTLVARTLQSCSRPGGWQPRAHRRWISSSSRSHVRTSSLNLRRSGVLPQDGWRQESKASNCRLIEARSIETASATTVSAIPYLIRAFVITSPRSANGPLTVTEVVEQPCRHRTTSTGSHPLHTWSRMSRKCGNAAPRRPLRSAAADVLSERTRFVNPDRRSDSRPRDEPHLRLGVKRERSSVWRPRPQHRSTAPATSVGLHYLILLAQCDTLLMPGSPASRATVAGTRPPPRTRSMPGMPVDPLGSPPAWGWSDWSETAAEAVPGLRCSTVPHAPQPGQRPTHWPTCWPHAEHERSVRALPTPAR
jgi:hypothetical protein